MFDKVKYSEKYGTQQDAVLCAGFAQVSQRVLAVVRASYEENITRDLAMDKRMPNWLHPKAFGNFVEALSHLHCYGWGGGRAGIW